MDRYAPRVSLKLPDRGWPNSEQALQLASFNFRRRLNTTVYPTGAHVPKETIYRQTTVLSLNGGIKPHQGHEMILTQYRRSSLLSIILLFAIASMVSAEDNWVLLHRGQGGDRDVYYDKQSIRKIDGSIMEVYIKVLDARNRHSVQQVQIDTENQKLASGLRYTYVNGSRTQRMDFSKPVWVWFPPMNVADKKLLNLVCKQN